MSVALPDESADRSIRHAIHARRLVQFVYRSKPRVTEPHDYGVRNDVVWLFVWQTGGASSTRLPGWRWINVLEIEQLVVLEQTFAGSRNRAGQRHQRWDQLFCRVE